MIRNARLSPLEQLSRYDLEKRRIVSDCFYIKPQAFGPGHDVCFQSTVDWVLLNCFLCFPILVGILLETCLSACHLPSMH